MKPLAPFPLFSRPLAQKDAFKPRIAVQLSFVHESLYSLCTSLGPFVMMLFRLSNPRPPKPLLSEFSLGVIKARRCPFNTLPAHRYG